MSPALQGRSMLVTGGGSGIGRAVVDAYVAAGARVGVLERSDEGARQLRLAHGDAVRVVVGDATDADAVKSAVDTASHGGRLDQLTCCVGVFDNYASVRDLNTAQLGEAASEIWRTNVYSVLLAVNRAYPNLRAAHGSITVTLSESGFRPAGGGVLYGSSKWALRGVVSHLARDLAPDVRINGVAPGGTTGTRLAGPTALGHAPTADQVTGRDDRIREANLLHVLPEPADHAGAYLYLADPDASRVCTGVVIRTDGGAV